MPEGSLSNMGNGLFHKIGNIEQGLAWQVNSI